ncbi:MAG: protein-disulfide reductase DsbD family protein [Gammaproteobacteria bacterium]|nr:protein-disulfide reductase DsbD family protein [Gammaproteobacteria bacterium]
MDRKQHFLLRLSIPFGLMLALAGVRASAQSDGLDLLPPSAAFRLMVSRPHADFLRVRWTIAKGYYLYRERFRFEATPAKVQAAFTLPPGIVKQDPFFGNTEIYRHQLAFDLPLETDGSAAEWVNLRIVSQGCADIGICFPPEARQVRLRVGETMNAVAEDPLAPAGAGKTFDLLSPLPLGSPEAPDSVLSP